VTKLRDRKVTKDDELNTRETTTETYEEEEKGIAAED